jgi:hypothetical protein
MEGTNNPRTENDFPSKNYREQFTAAMVVAAAKVEKKDKEETPNECYERIKVAKILKENKSVKSAAKKLLKKKKIQKMTCYFSRK